MTTTVRILVEGNKACEAKVVDPLADSLRQQSAGIQVMQPAPKLVQPGSFVILNIHGEQKVEVREVGDFLS